MYVKPKINNVDLAACVITPFKVAVGKFWWCTYGVALVG